MRKIAGPTPPLNRRTFIAGASTAAVTGIGPFVSAAGAQVQPDIRVVHSSGYSQSGRGAALYVADEAVDRAYVTRNPRTSFVSESGRGFRLSLDQTITPFMFGAVGSATFNAETPGPLNDDREALQAFFDFCHTRRVESANWGGVFGISKGLIVGGPYGEAQLDYKEAGLFEGSIVLTPVSDISGAVLTIHSRRQVTYGPIAIVGRENAYLGSLARKNRLFDIGILVEDKAQLQLFSTVYVTGARIAGMFNQTRLGSGDNTFQNHVSNAYFLSCGSGSLNPASFQTATLATRANSGSPSQLNQRTTLTVSELPPAIVTDYFLPCLVKIGGDYHVVLLAEDGKPLIDRSRNQVTVFPWVSAAASAGSKIEYVYGGGLVTLGGDAGISSGKVASTGCSIGLLQGATYTGHYIGTFQSCLFGYVHGSNPANAALGGTLKAYFEDNRVDVLWNAVLGGNAHFTLLAEHALDISKIMYWRPRMGDNNFLNGRFKPQTLLMNIGGRWHHFENEPDIDGGTGLAHIGFDRPAGDIIPLHADNAEIRLVDVGRDFNRLFGYRARVVQVTGTGPNNTPTGSIAVVPWATLKINGAAPGTRVTFQPFSAAVTMQIALDPADATNCLVSIFSGR